MCVTATLAFKQKNKHFPIQEQYFTFTGCCLEEGGVEGKVPHLGARGTLLCGGRFNIQFQLAPI